MVRNTSTGIRNFVLGGILLAIAMVLVVSGRAPATSQPTLTEIYRVLHQKTFVDLTHVFEPGIPRWSGFPDSKRELLYWYEPGVGELGSGFWTEYFCHVGQWGTHADPPAHFFEGLRSH